jgi:ethanolamine utilization protein EutN
VHLGRVTTAIVAPTKHPSLVGSKFLVVDLEESRDGHDGRPPVLAVDTVGAGIGDQVIVAMGSHAVSVVAPGAAVDAVIVGIVDPPVTLTQQQDKALAATPSSRPATRRATTRGGKADG